MARTQEEDSIRNNQTEVCGYSLRCITRRNHGFGQVGEELEIYRTESDEEVAEIVGQGYSHKIVEKHHLEHFDGHHQSVRPAEKHEHHDAESHPTQSFTETRHCLRRRFDLRRDIVESWQRCLDGGSCQHSSPRVDDQCGIFECESKRKLVEGDRGLYVDSVSCGAGLPG